MSQSETMSAQPCDWGHEISPAAALAPPPSEPLPPRAEPIEWDVRGQWTKTDEAES